METFNQNERPIPKVVGPASEKIKNEYQGAIMERFNEQHFDQFPENGERLLLIEYDKRPYEIACIQAANKVTNRLLEEAGMPPFDIPEKNIHIIPKDSFDEVCEGASAAVVIKSQQAMFARADRIRKAPIYTASIFLHEITHLKERLVLQVNEDLDLRGMFRSGVKIESTLAKDQAIGGTNTYFFGLQEAIVTTIQKKYLPELVSHIPELQEEAEWLASEEALALKKEFTEKAHFSEEDIVWISKDGSECKILGYSGQRKVLDLIVEAVFEDNPDLFASRDDAENMFIKAHLSGRLMEIARLIEKSFGKGAFRNVGEMGITDESAYAKFVGLSKKRRHIKGQREKSSL